MEIVIFFTTFLVNHGWPNDTRIVSVLKKWKESFLQETHYFTTWDCPQKHRWNVGWKQERRGWSQEGQWEGEELDSECVVTTSSEPRSQTWMLHTLPIPLCPCVSESVCHHNFIQDPFLTRPVWPTGLHKYVLNPDISVIIISREEEGASSGKKSRSSLSGVEHVNDACLQDVTQRGFAPSVVMKTSN